MTRKPSRPVQTISREESAPASDENPRDSVIPEKQFPLRPAVGQSGRILSEVGGQHRRNL